MVTIELNRANGDFGFEAVDANSHVVRIDSSPETGGEDFGARPMQMLLMALGGCSGIDIISILKKQKQQVDQFRIRISGEREAGNEATLWKSIDIDFQLTGKIDEEKAKRACELSIGKYCSVAATLRAAGATIGWTVEVINPIPDQE